MYRDGCGRKWPGVILKYYQGFYLKVLKMFMKTSISMTNTDRYSHKVSL